MIVTDKYVFFYGDWPSNFTNASFKWTHFNETHEFFCTEQAFMWAKAKFFGDEEIAAHILAEGNTKNPDPMTCKSLGRMVRNYDEIMEKAFARAQNALVTHQKLQSNYEQVYKSFRY